MKRLLTADEAAEYCGIGVDSFHTNCTVKRVRIAPKVLRYDTHDLDRWLARRPINTLGDKVPKSGFVYFVMFLDEYIKIGWSKDVHARIRELQTGSPEDLVLLGFCHGDPTDERNLHHQFRHLRIRGEWFAADLTLQHFIKGVLK